MNQKRMIWLATLVAAVTALLMVFGFWLSFDLSAEEYRIELPPAPSQPSTAVPGTSAMPEVTLAPHTQGVLAITAENVTTIVADLVRPGAYSCQNTVTLYWENGLSTTRQNVVVLDGFQRIDYLDAAGNPEQYEIVGLDTAFVWDNTPGALPQPLSNGDFQLDAAARMPTYEAILSLPAMAIRDADYVLLDDKPCVWVRTAPAGMSGNLVEYFVSLDTGLLVKATAFQDGSPAWDYEMSQLDLTTPQPEAFLLPTGITAMEAQAVWNPLVY